VSEFPRRGEVWMVQFAGVGSEVSDRHPAVIIQNDTGNEFSPTTVVVTITSRWERVYRFMVRLDPPEGGLTRPSVVNGSSMATVDRIRLLRRMGQLSPQRIADVERAVKANLALD
jgi:mRNA interferase MazF